MNIATVKPMPHIMHTLAKTGHVVWRGIDMMRLTDGRLHPVVEINLRRNMGILALTLYKRGLTAPQALTPPSSGGFQMVIDRGMLRILRSG